ncbi:MAG TPA: DEAD/DEAH box helicase, partial [Gammaproteobacteria bacterium]|nr:DEAD/DEAH box helicase [Gammaproteobacteria bacterium]
MTTPTHSSPFQPPCPSKAGFRSQWGQLYGSSYGLVLSATATQHKGPVLVITADMAAAQRLEYSLRFYMAEENISILQFPDWETLPYDRFSPHQDIISERLTTLSRLPDLTQGILITPIQTLMHRIAPKSYLDGFCLSLGIGQKFNIDDMRLRLEHSGYNCVSSVMEHGEFAVRGSLFDLFPMGSKQPFRIELFDDEIESIRTFNPETQISIDKVEKIQLLPAREFPLNKEAISHFRTAFRARFEGDPQQTNIYRDVTNGIASPGIEYYLPLFFEETISLFDYLPDSTLLITADDVNTEIETFWTEINERYEQARHDVEHPLLSPHEVFIPVDEVFSHFKRFPRVELQHFEREDSKAINFSTQSPPPLNFDIRAHEAAAALKQFLDNFKGRVLFAAETTGRRETLIEMLRDNGIKPTPVNNWHEFIHSKHALAITVAPLDEGLLLNDPAIAVISEPQLFGLQVLQRRRRKKSQRDTDSIVKNLAELTLNSPVVHEDYGVGRYQGLQTLKIGELDTEFLTLIYANDDKLYVPVSSLHLISRYTGAAPENAPLHRLGSGQWEKAKKKAREQVHDVAAELLDIYARREAQSGFSYPLDEMQYQAFSASFPFEETPDQQTAIDNVIRDMRSPKPMDQLVCGDVGFGKTEVAMRAAFIAVQAGKQVAVLSPTTLLTQQHTENFRDRF